MERSCSPARAPRSAWPRARMGPCQRPDERRGCRMHLLPRSSWLLRRVPQSHREQWLSRTLLGSTQQQRSRGGLMSVRAQSWRAWRCRSWHLRASALRARIPRNGSTARVRLPESGARQGARTAGRRICPGPHSKRSVISSQPHATASTRKAVITSVIGPRSIMGVCNSTSTQSWGGWSRTLLQPCTSSLACITCWSGIRTRCCHMSLLG
mmetsp:Transcript_103722/g.334385  ORF Transcript_103722/g.334385 Transcript_103722/m.334385 type:complete len:210 (+) Transcript_103722:1856-2485(+)